MDKETIEAAVASASHKGSIFGAVYAAFGWVASSEGAAVIGLAIAFIGFCINWYYRAKADKRSQEEHLLRMQRLAEGKRTDTDIGALE